MRKLKKFYRKLFVWRTLTQNCKTRLKICCIKSILLKERKTHSHQLNLQKKVNLKAKKKRSQNIRLTKKAYAKSYWLNQIIMKYLKYQNFRLRTKLKSLTKNWLYNCIRTRTTRLQPTRLLKNCKLHLSVYQILPLKENMIKSNGTNEAKEMSLGLISLLTAAVFTVDPVCLDKHSIAHRVLGAAEVT